MLTPPNSEPAKKMGFAYDKDGNAVESENAVGNENAVENWNKNAVKNENAVENWNENWNAVENENENEADDEVENGESEVGIAKKVCKADVGEV